MINKKILVVDDDVEVRETFVNILNELGYEVSTSGCGEEALPLVIMHDFDVILSDFAMPNGDGLWLLQKVKELGSKAPFVLVTGNAEISEKTVLDGGGFGLLRKPASAKDYRSIVAAALDSLK